MTTGIVRKDRKMRELLESGHLVVSPGVYDGYSARLAQQMGFEAASTTGAGLANSALGMPDVGILGLLTNVDLCRHMARSIDIPLMADADTGYGNAVTVFHAIQYFEEAGVVGVNLEDQESPKRCGHLQGKTIIPAREMAKKIEAAVRAKRSSDFIINARTDAIALEGIEGAQARVKMYQDAGADMVYPDSVRSLDDIERILEVARVPVSINIGFGIRARAPTPMFALPKLQAMGVARVSVPRIMLGAAILAMRNALTALKDARDDEAPPDRTDLCTDMGVIMGLLDYARIEKLEEEFMLEEDLAARYPNGKPNMLSEGH